jgi:transcriptional regulator with XRE-family HTH domain
MCFSKRRKKMSVKKSLGEKLSVLAKSSDRKQSEISESLGMPASQLNRFFRGRSDVNSSNLAAILRELGIDLDRIISERVRKTAGVDEVKIQTTEDCLTYLFRSLDELGKQTYLNSLAWAAKAATKKDLPRNVVDLLKQETTLI